MRAFFSVISLSLAPSIKLATMSAMSVLISAGAVLGKTNLVQLVLMALVEVTAFDVMRMIQRKYFLVSNSAARRGLRGGGVRRCGGCGTPPPFGGFSGIKKMYKPRRGSKAWSMLNV